MKLFLLRPLDTERGPWNPWYDKCFGFVVRATSEGEARQIAQSEAGDEKRYADQPWLDASLSSCDVLTTEGEVGVVIQDFHAA